MTFSLISFRNVSKVYNGNVKALDRVSLQIDKGEFVFIVGENGAGKSTLIKMMYREETPSSGQVFVLGKDLAKMRKREVPYLRRRIGVVFQDFKLLKDKNAWENVAFALEVTGTPRREVNRRVTQVLNMVGLLDRRNAFPTSFLRRGTAADSDSTGACGTLISCLRTSLQAALTRTAMKSSPSWNVSAFAGPRWL